MEIRVLECTCGQRFDLTQVSNPGCCALGALRASAPTSFFLSYHTVVVHVRTLWTADRLTRLRHGSRNKTSHIDPFNLVNLEAELMEAVHMELVRLATELEVVKGPVQPECNAPRDLFARTTTAMSSSVRQHDRGLDHREAGRHLPQQFGGSSLDYGDFAFLMEGYAAVLSRAGQGGALLAEVAKLEKFEGNATGTFGRTFWDVRLSAAVAAALSTCTRGEVATLVRRILSVSPGERLQAWFAVTQWFKPRSVVEQAASMARLISPKRTKNVNELHLAVMQWEPTLVEHEFKFSEVVALACAAFTFSGLKTGLFLNWLRK